MEVDPLEISRIAVINQNALFSFQGDPLLGRRGFMPVVVRKLIFLQLAFMNILCCTSTYSLCYSTQFQIFEISTFKAHSTNTAPKQQAQNAHVSRI